MGKSIAVTVILDFSSNPTLEIQIQSQLILKFDGITGIILSVNKAPSLLTVYFFFCVLFESQLLYNYANLQILSHCLTYTRVVLLQHHLYCHDSSYAQLTPGVNLKNVFHEIFTND